MKYTFNGKTLRIPDEDIERLKKSLDISKDEAIEIWLEDEGYLENEEQQALETKARENKITAYIHGAEKDKTEKKTQKERVRKADPIKEGVIKKLADALQDYGENIVIINPTKVITFTIGEDRYKLDLIRQRKKGAK